MYVVNTFRALTGATMAIFFTLIGVFFGLLWNKFKPYESAIQADGIIELAIQADGINLLLYFACR